MDVRLPDGTIVTNVPEGITQSELMRRVGLMSASPEVAPKPTGPAGFSLKDLAASFGIGAVGSTKALTDVAGAGNIASSKLSQGVESLQQSMTPERQAEMQRQAERMKAAEESGSFLEEIKAAGRNVMEAPLQTTAQAIGSFVPYLPTMFAAPIAAAMRLAPGAVRAITAVAEQAPKAIATAQGLGAVKGSIYDGVYQAEVDAGTNPDVARQKADAAQNYFGNNFEQIALGGALGLVAGSSGVEKFLTPAGRAGASQGLGRRVGETIAKESLPEGVQGGQERLAQNLALQRGGFDVDTFAGVAGAATGEALAGALGAAPIAALSRPAPRAAEVPPAEQATAIQKEPLAIGMSEPFVPRALPDGSVATTQAELDAYEKQKFEDKYAPQPTRTPEEIELAKEEERLAKAREEMKPAEVGYERSIIGAPAEPLAAILERNRIEGEKAKAKQYEVQLADLNSRADAATNPVIIEARNRVAQEKADLEETISILEKEFNKIYEREVKPEEEAAKAAEEKVAAAEKQVEAEELSVESTEEAPEFIEATPVEGEPAPQPEEVAGLQKDLEKAEKERRRFTQGKAKGLSLWTALRGTLTPEEVNDIGPGLMFKSLQKKGGVGGTDMSSLVSDGKLNDFLPPRMRPSSEFHDEQESVEYIKEKLRRNNYYTFDTNMAIQNADNTVEELEKAIRELLTLEEINLEIQQAVDEQAAIDRETQEAPTSSETGVTEERQGKDATAAEGLTSPTPEEIVAKQDAAAKAEKQRKDEEKAKEEKAKADEARADFTLTGSEREADVAAARGQKDLLEAKKEVPKEEITLVSDDKGTNRDGDSIRNIELSNGSKYQIIRLTSSEGMGLAGWHDNNKHHVTDFAWLGASKEEAIAELIKRETESKVPNKRADKEKPPVLDTANITPAKGRHPQVQAAATKLNEGNMSREEFEKYVDYYRPIEAVDVQNLDRPASDFHMDRALRGGGGGKLNAPIKEGARVGLRMDLPARDAGANVVSIHEGKENDNPKTGQPYTSAGKVISYQSVARIKDVFFAPRDQEKSLKMGIGMEFKKEPLQTAEGTWVPTTPDEAYADVKRLAKDPSWTQVNFDPTRHGYFYDRATGKPVSKASELIQVGNFILAKDVEYAPKSEFLYSEEKGATGFNNTQENLDITKAIEGKSMIQVAKWMVDNAPNAFAKHFAQKALDRIKQMEARGVKFGFEILTADSRPISMRNARGAANFIWGKEAKGESTTISIILNGPTVVKNQAGYPPGVEYRTILHELLHVATRGQLQFLASSDPLVKEIRSLFNSLISKYNDDVKNNRLSGITKDYYDRRNNAFADPDEMVSWGLTDERMQKYMSGIEVGKKSVFSKLIDLVRRVVGISPAFESALDRLVQTSDRIMSEELDDLANGMKLQGYTFGNPKSKKTTGVQQSLFSKRVGEMFANQEGVSNAGQDALDLMAKLGRTVKEPDAGYIAKVRQSWDNVKDNPKLTSEEAGNAVTKFLDRVQTWAFSSDAALNNSIRRAVMDSTKAAKDKIGTLLSTSLSQTVHADAVASLFITQGNVVYDKELYKWKGVEDKANFVELSRDIDRVAEKYGLTKEQAELIAHTAFEAKRLKSMVEFNDQIDREVAQMRAEAAAIRKEKPVAASALSDKASKRLTEKKFIHMTDDEIAAGNSLFASMPELNAAVKTWNSIRENTVAKLVDSGLWDEAEAEFMLDNADYVPFFREDQLEEGKGPKEYIRGLMVQAKEKKLKGSNKPVNDIFDNMIRWTQYSINRAVRNQSALSLIDAALDPEVKMAKKVKDRSSGENVVRVWRDGKEEFYDMADPMFIEAFTGLEAIAIPSWKWASKLSNMLRQSVVLYPLFSVSQVPQDAFAAMFSSGLKPRFALTIPARAVKEFALTLFNRSKTQDELKQFGVVGVRDFTSSMVRMDAEIYAGFKAQPGVLNKVKNVLSHIAMASDNAVRQAVYEASMAQGISKAEALEKSFEIWNVRRRGTSKNLALAGQVIPFFNAYLAAQNVAYKTITGVSSSPTERKAALETLLATTGSVMALSLIYAMMNGDDEDYENKPAIVRDRLLMIPGTGGLSIPLRADLFTLPKVVTEHMYLLITDKGYEDGRKFRDSIKNILGSALLSPTAVPQAIKPLVEVGINYNFFTGRPLIGEFEKKKETARQFTDSTSELAKWFGSSGLVSPIAADHLIRGMFGSAGGLVIYMTNPLLHSDPNVDRPSMSWREAAATLPGTSGFISREYESGLKNDFYVLRDEVSKVANTMADLKARSPEKIDEYLSKEEIAVRYGMAKSVAKMTEQLGSIRKSISRITNLPNSEMSADEKMEAIKELRAAERDMLKGINVKELRAMAKI